MIRIILATLINGSALAQTLSMDFKAERISRTAVFTVKTSLKKAFPLFGPLLEMEWAYGWEPRIIYLDQKNVAEHMIFQTKGQYGEDYLWTVTQYEPENYLIEYTVTAANRIWFIRVQCEADDKNTKVTVSYTYTGLNEKGNDQNKAALEKMFVSDLKDWEEAINYYLETGKQLR